MQPTHYPVVIVGGGQAGLSMSYYLQQAGIDHLVFEKHSAMHVWRDHRWDSFCLVTPNWQCQLPGYDYAGAAPHGFMKKDELNEYLAAFKRAVAAPLREGVAVLRIAPLPGGGFGVSTAAGEFTADQVVVAAGGYHLPIIPRLAERLAGDIRQLHSEEYKNPASLPAGGVLVVGTGQSGAQIAEDLHLAGRKVFLAVGKAPRCARFYRGKDVVDWLAEMRYYEMPVDAHPLREGVRDNTNHYVTGRDGGRDIDLRKFALEGMELYGVLAAADRENLYFKENLRANLDAADAVYNGINASIDKYIEKHGIDAGRHDHLVHRIRGRLQLAGRCRVQRPRPAAARARRHLAAGLVLLRIALVAYLGLGTLFRRGPRCPPSRGLHPASPRGQPGG
jgi:putative flavoprotein involved in K+ transport